MLEYLYNVSGRIILMKSKLWWCVNFIILISSLFAIMFCVYRVDPYFHYHKPQVEKYFYKLDNDRAQNKSKCSGYSEKISVNGKMGDLLCAILSDSFRKILS